MVDSTIEEIRSGACLLAILVRRGHFPEGTSFITGPQSAFQLALHARKGKYRYKSHFMLPYSHIENLHPNKIYWVISGKLGCDIYDNHKTRIAYVEANPGDCILFLDGAHGVDALNDAEFIEVKQGPYRGVQQDKRFIE